MSSKKPVQPSTDSRDSETPSTKIERDKRRRERAAAIAAMGVAGHPFAAAADALNKQVIAQEDKLAKDRGLLMSMLRGSR
jgi:hypothetical protein